MKATKHIYLVSFQAYHEVCKVWIDRELLFYAPHSIAIRDYAHDMNWKIQCILELTTTEAKRHDGLRSMTL